MARTPSPRAGASNRRRTDNLPATLLVASDWAPIRAFEPIVRNAPESVYGDILPVLRRADLRIVNCESALTSAVSAVWKSGAVFKGEPAHVAGLKAVPFDVACLANKPCSGLRRCRASRDAPRAGTRGNEDVGAGLTDAQALSRQLR